MSLRNILLIAFLLFPFLLFAQGDEDSEWVEVEASIQNIEQKSSGGKIREFALVSFVTEDGQEAQAMVEVFRIPFIGSFKSIGDKITVNYRKDNPALAETNSGKFLSTYGMYILILLGVIFSVRAIVKARKKQYY